MYYSLVGTTLTPPPRLRVLLYTPHLANPQTAPLAYATIARAVTQTLYTYAELIATHQLHPSWPQVQRLVVCGQLLILCHEAGEFHVHEAPKLFQMLVDALDKHEPTWPVCGELAAGFGAAARVYGELSRSNCQSMVDHCLGTVVTIAR